MVDVDTFLTTLYVLVDDFCRRFVPPEPLRPGHQPSLSWSEVLTLAIFGQWAQFPTERAFYRWAVRRLLSAFPTLPHRAQFNRLMRRHQDTLTHFALYLGHLDSTKRPTYELFDGTAAPTRNAKRRGYGWLVGQTNLGWSNRLGWYHGFHLLTVATPTGRMTGFCFAPASTNDRHLADTLLAVRYQPHPRLPSAGSSSTHVYVADSGFWGLEWLRQWQEDYGADVICPPQRDTRYAWSKPWRRWLAGIRQVNETVHHHLLFTFRLDRERPHALPGFAVRLAAKVALYNLCIWFNERLGRPPLAFADLLAW